MKMIFKFFKTISSKGVTLIELVVALSIFALVVPLATSLLISIMQNQRKLLTQVDLLNQANYAVEYMSRALRTAIKEPGSACAGGMAYAYDAGDTNQSSVKFINHNNPSGDICQEFHLNNSGFLEEIKIDSTGNTLNNLFSSAYKVVAFKVYLSPDPSNPSTSPKYQPRVTLYLDVKLNTGESNPPEVKMQTTISQRNLDI